MIRSELARLRRLYHHVVRGGSVRSQDIAMTIEYLEKVDNHQYFEFEDWYNEIENFSLRSERLSNDVEELRAAFYSGRNHE